MGEKQQQKDAYWEQKMDVVDTLIKEALSRVPVITYPQLFGMVDGAKKSIAHRNHIIDLVQESMFYEEKQIEPEHRKGPYWTNKLNTTKYFIRMQSDAQDFYGRDGLQQWYPHMKYKKSLSLHIALQSLNLSMLSKGMLYGSDTVFSLSVPDGCSDNEEGAQAMLRYGTHEISVYLLPFRRSKTSEKRYQVASGYLYRMSKIQEDRPVLLLCPEKDYYKAFSDVLRYLNRKNSDGRPNSYTGSVYLLPWEAVLKEPDFYLESLVNAEYQKEYREFQITNVVFPGSEIVRDGKHNAHLYHGTRIFRFDVFRGDMKMALGWLTWDTTRTGVKDGKTVYGWLFTFHPVMAEAISRVLKPEHFLEGVSALLTPSQVYDLQQESLVTSPHELTQEEMDALFDEDDTTIPDDENPFLLD